MFVPGLDSYIANQIDKHYNNEDDGYEMFIENPPLDWDEILNACFSAKEKSFGYSSAFEDLCDAIGLDNVQEHCDQIRDAADKVMKGCFEHFGQYASLAEKAYEQAWRHLFDEYVKGEESYYEPIDW